MLYLNGALPGSGDLLPAVAEGYVDGIGDRSLGFHVVLLPRVNVTGVDLPAGRDAPAHVWFDLQIVRLVRIDIRADVFAPVDSALEHRGPVLRQLAGQRQAH